MAKNAFLESPYSDVVDTTEATTVKPQEAPKPAATTDDTESAAPTTRVRTSRSKDGSLPPDTFRPIFDEAATKYDVPVNVLMAIGDQESGYNSTIVGQPTKWGRAKGMMQYLDSTATGMGINPLDAGQSINAAAKQIRERLDKGYSMEDAVKEHFAGPDRKQWGAKTAVYGQEVMHRAGTIGSLLTGGAASPSGAGKSASPDTAALQGQLDQEEPGRYKVLTQDDAENAFSTSMPRDTYEQTFRSLNPRAPQQLVDTAMQKYDADASARAKAVVNKAPAQFDVMASPDKTFDQNLNKKLQGPANGIVPQLPGKIATAPAPAFDPEAAARESKLSAIGSYLQKSAIAGGYDLAGVGAKLLDELNPWTTTPSEAAILFKNDPNGLKKLQDSSSAMIFSRFAQAMSKNSDEALGGMSDRAKRDYGADSGTEYATLDADKTAFANPVKVIGDAVRSVPAAAAMAIAVFLTRGAAARAEATALAAGADATVARQAGIEAGKKMMAGAGAGSEGLVGYAQQANQSYADAAKVTDADMAKSPRYQQLIASGYAPESARAKILADTGEQAGQIAGIVDATVNKVGGEFLGKILTEGGKLIPRIMKGIANEGATEFVQSAGEQVGQNIATKTNINPNQSLSEGVGEAAVAGLAVGGLMGGTMAGVGGRGHEAAAPVKPSGPLTSAVEKVAEPKGAQIVGDDGVVYDLKTGADGVSLEPQVAKPAGPLTAAVETVAKTSPVAPQPAAPIEEVAGAQTEAEAPATQAQPETDVVPAAPKPEPVAAPAKAEKVTKDEVVDTDGVVHERQARIDLTAPAGEMTDEELRERLKYIAGQGKENGWNKMLIDARRTVEKEINTRAKQLPVAEVKEPELKLTGLTDRARANAAMLKAAETTGAPHEVVERDQKGKTLYDVRPIDQGRTVPGAGVSDRNSTDGQGGGKDVAAPAVAETSASAARAPVPTTTAADKPSALTPNEHAGKWFGSTEKAEAYIAKKKIGDTHSVEQTGKVRFEIKPKAASHVDVAAQEAALHPANDLPEPTQAQKEAGNYKMGHATVHGMDISIENPRGSERSGLRPDGTKWSHTMSDHYGYVKGTVGNDGDHVDVYVGSNPDSNKVFVVDQMHQDGSGFDEHKAMLGFDSKEQAVAAYASNFDKGWKVGPVTEMSVDQFREWSKDAAATKKPASTISTAAPTKGVANENTETAGSKSNADAKPDQAGTSAESGDNQADAEAQRSAAPVAEEQVANDNSGGPDNEPPPSGKAKTDRFAGNKVFTSDKVEAARARLKSKLGQLNSGIDPEMMMDGLTISGAYLEAGVRKFADYAKAMTDDFGDAIKPYLLSFYEAARHYPGMETDGMSTPKVAQAQHDAMMVEASEIAKPAAVADTGSKEIKNDTEPTAKDAAGSVEGQAAERVRQDAGGRQPELFPQQPDGDRGVVDTAGARDGDQRNDNGGQAGVRGKSSDAATVAGEPVQSGRGSGVEPSDRADNKPVSAIGSNYRIQPGELTRDGSWRDTAARNVDVVELIKKIEAEKRRPTDAERAQMAKFTGWGASEIANGIFPDRYGHYKTQAWQQLGERLKAALTPEEYDAARRTTQYAHYTSEGVIRSIYSGLDRLGFKGGTIVEPGMGVGSFAGLMPDHIAANSHYTGIEYEPVTAAIAKALYPQSNITHGDFTKTALPKDFFDAAIGNPPFSGTVVLNDPEYKSRRPMLHDYFFMKTLDRVKPGGLLVFVTSKGTMDKTSDKSRSYLAERANLLGAIRLPQTAFQANAGTEVVTDVIFLQKRGPGISDNGVQWLGTAPVKAGEQTANVNEYFASHPEMVLGEHALTGSMYRKDEYTVTPRAGSNIEADFAKAIESLPENVTRPPRGSLAERAVVQDRDFNPKHKKEGGLYVSEDGKLMQVEDGSGVQLDHRTGADGKKIAMTPKQKKWLRDYVGVRDALKQAQFDQLNDGPWEKSLKALNDAYEAFTKANGPILDYTTIERTNPDGTTTETKRYKNEPLLRMDAEGALAYALEKVKEDGTIVKGLALTERVLKRPAEPQIKTTSDALFVSLNRTGALDVNDVAALAGTDRETVLRDLGTAVYEAPGGQWQLADEYTSGNVLKKLKEAQAAAKIDKRFQRNVEALLAVQPKPLGPSDISVRLGANWVPGSDIENFAKDVLNQRTDVTYSHLTGQWNVTPYGRNIDEWNTDKMSAGAILDSVLNNRQIKITWRDQEGKTHTDLEATEKANDVAGKMKEAFRSWIWKDTERSGRLVQHYNDNFNNIAPRQFDGSHLTLPGMTARFVPHAHQKRAVWRVIQQGDTYLAHAVGSGKTAEMIMAGMEERRLGLSQKPTYVVPNHMLAQFSREFLELYPAANIMVADENNFHTHNRKRFIAQAALNNPDAIVITHSAFGRVGMSDAFTEKFIKSQIAEWQEALADADKGDRITVKQIEKRIEGLEKKLEGKQGAEKKDRVMTFEELGADRLFVDEFHEFRKLDFPTNQGNIKGIDPNGSQKALDLFMKVQYLREKNPGRVLVAASGTPVTNTMGELYTAQRFFQPEQLKEDGLTSFDAWASQYGDVATGFEQNAAGGYEMVSRFSKFVNVPELMRRVRSFMDILTGSNLGALVHRPDVETGGRQILVTPAPEGYKEYQKTLEARIKKIRETKGKPAKGADIILKVIGDGRFSAIDMRFVDPTLPSDPNSKLNQMLDAVISDYRATSDYEYHTDNKTDPIKGASHLIFSDIGLGEQSAASRGFDMRAWMEHRFTEAGIPKEHVAFMRDYKQSSKKERLFADMREGKKRILIGGKEMETGTNVQKRLISEDQLDAPWFPASVEQREGRIIRQGNQNPQVRIRAHATKGSYDSTMWGMNARKARFIEQAMNGDDTVRSLEDVSEASAFEMAAALASGDERFMKLAGLKADVEKLDRLRHAHYDEQRSLKQQQNWATDRIDRAESLIGDLNKAIAKRQDVAAGEFSGKVGKSDFDSREEFSMALFDEFKRLGDENTAAEKTLATVGGFAIKYYGVARKGSGIAADLHVDIPGDPNPLLSYPLDPGVAINGLATRALNQINGMDRKVADAKDTITTNKRTLDQISKRIGAAFPEEQILLEKVSELESLQTELASEQPAVEVSAEALAATPKEAVEPTEEQDEPRYSVNKDGKAEAEFGPAYTEYADKPAEAIDRLMEEKTGEAVAAVTRPDLGEISLVYGNADYGLKHIADRRGADFFKRLPDLLRSGNLYTKEGQIGRVFVGDAVNEAALRLDWDGKAKTWLVSAYEKYPEGSTPAGTTNRNTAEPNRGTSGVPKSQRSTVVMRRIGDSGKGMTAPQLNTALRSGNIGAAIGNLIDSGKITLYTTAKKLPKHLTGPSGIQAVTDRDGSIHVVSNTLSPERAQAVVLHEMFHGGVKSLLGTEQWANLQGRLASLYRQGEQSSGKAREFWDKARERVAEGKKLGGISTRYEVEEFGAYAIEEYESAPLTVRKWVDDLVGAIKAWLVQRFGKQLGQVTPAQLRAFSVAAIRAANAETSVATAGDDLRFSVHPGTTQFAVDLTPEEQGRFRTLQSQLQDNMNRVRQVQDRIEELTGQPVPEGSDYYGAETNRPGRIAARLEDGKNQLTKPLMTRLAKSDNTPEQLAELLHAMHAQERNEAIERINPKLTDGSGMSTPDANAILKKYAGNTELHAIAQQARDITRATLDMKLAYGLIDNDTYGALTNAYNNYIPLKGDGEYGPKVKRAMGHGGRDEHILENIARDYDQAVVVGEKNLARQALLSMVAQNPDPDLWTIGVPPKGRYVAGQVYNVVDIGRGAPKDGRTVGSFTSRSQVDAFLEGLGSHAIHNYIVLDSKGDRVQEFTKQLQDNEVMVYVGGQPVRIQVYDEKLAAQLRPLNQGQMNWLLENGRELNRYLSKIYTGYNPAFILRNTARDAMTGTINMLGNQGAEIAAKAWIKYPAALKTLGQWAATGKTPVGKTGDYLTEYRMHGGKVGASWMSDLEEQGKTLARMYDDAYGATGFLNDGKVGKAALIAGRKTVAGMAHVVEIGNQATENALRLSLYMALREDGATPGKAAQAAKTVTVDFDRKGSSTGMLGAIYLFINPAIQGTANAMKTLIKGEHKAQAWGALGALAALGVYAAAAGYDDDKDRWLGESWDTRSKNFILRVGDHNIRVPISQEFAPAYAFGVALTEAARGEKKMTTALRLLSSFIDAYFPMKGAYNPDSDNHLVDAVTSMVPTAIRPATEIAINRNSFGSQIVPENEMTKDRPDNSKMFRATKNSVYDSTAQAIAGAGVWAGLAGDYENDITKVSPETLKYLWRTYTGGLGQFVTDSAGTMKSVADPESDTPMTSVPIVKDFWRERDVKPIRGRYYQFSDEAKKAATEFQQAKKAGDGEAIDRLAADPEKLNMISLSKMFKAQGKAAASLRDEAVSVNADKNMTPAEKVKALKDLEKQEEEVYRAALDAFK